MDKTKNAIDNLIEIHTKKYGIEPNVIGYLWFNMNKHFDLLVKAVEGDKPYDEYKMLTKSEQEAFDKGELIF